MPRAGGGCRSWPWRPSPTWSARGPRCPSTRRRSEPRARTFLLHLRHGLPLPEAVATVSATPARRVGLEDRGEIGPGLRADLVRARLLGDLPVVVAARRAGERIA